MVLQHIEYSGFFSISLTGRDFEMDLSKQNTSELQSSVVFDEAPIGHCYIFEILNRTREDLLNCVAPFECKIFLCCRKFCQIAPIVEKAHTPSDIALVSL